MTTRELNSYTLMEKLRIVSDIETLSGEYIIRKIKKSRAANGLSEERLIDEEFKEKYTECQKSYRELKLQETTYLFNHFK